jgi:hypothetical protein
MATYLFVPVGSECNPDEDQGLHQCAANHAAPNTLHDFGQYIYHLWSHITVFVKKDESKLKESRTISS